jgi:hypothetical protein
VSLVDNNATYKAYVKALSFTLSEYDYHLRRLDEYRKELNEKV